MCDPTSIVVLGLIFYFFSSNNNSLKEKFESKYSKHIKDLKRINDKLGALKNKDSSKMSKKEAEKYYPLYEESANIAHNAVIEFSEIHLSISEEIDKLQQQINSNKEPQKSKYIGEKKLAILMHKTMIENVANAKKLRNKLHEDQENLRQILRSK